MTRRRALLAALIPLTIGLAAFLLARRLDRVSAPEPGSDLDAPVLIGRNELGFEALADDRQLGVPILCYHYFGPGFTSGRLVRVLGAVLLNLPTLPDRDYWTTTVPEFERQMDYLAANGWRTAFLDDVLDALEAGRLPERTVVITIDDGDRTVLEYAVPVLRRHGFVATLFMLTGHAGEEDWNDLDFLDWPALQALEREGVIRVESHTHRMHTKTRVRGGPVPRFLMPEALSEGLLRADLESSRDTMVRHLGHEPTFLAWPFGYGRADVDSLARAAGFRRVLTLKPFRNGIETGESEPLGRYAVTARTSSRVFRLMLEPHGDRGADSRNPW
ncbi:MAG: polysaccharide deacetylase family protein [bacterium]